MNDIPRMVKLMLYASNDDNTDQDAGGVETATEDDNKLVTQELQNTSCAKPEGVTDFKVYLSVIIKSSRHFQDFDFALYD